MLLLVAYGHAAEESKVIAVSEWSKPVESHDRFLRARWGSTVRRGAQAPDRLSVQGPLCFPPSDTGVMPPRIPRRTGEPCPFPGLGFGIAKIKFVWAAP